MSGHSTQRGVFGRRAARDSAAFPRPQDILPVHLLLIISVLCATGAFSYRIRKIATPVTHARLLMGGCAAMLTGTFLDPARSSFGYAITVVGAVATLIAGVACTAEDLREMRTGAGR